MSLVFIDGFDHYASGDELLKWDGSTETGSNYGSPTVETGRDNRGKCVKYDFGHTLKYVPQQDTYLVGFAFKWTGTNNTAYTILRFCWGGNAQVTLRLATDGKIQAYREEVSEVALGTPTRVLTVDTWYYIECKAKVHNTLGSVEVHIDGLLDSLVETADTVVDTGAVINGIAIGGGGAVGTYYWFDDLYIADTGGGRNNDFLGICRVDTLVPNANGASSQWAGSDGNQTDNYALVDEVAASFTDNVQGGTVDQVDLYGVSDMPFTPESINGVQTTVYAKRNSASFRKIAAVTRIEGVNYVETGRWLSVSPRYYTHLDEVQPSGSGIWTKAIVDATQFGVKVLS